ncbi:MAG: hypothetical protein LDLANPLL_01033 [Turneriella sp.]|nr:hypothetical protein [Turneriella sp.]
MHSWPVGTSSFFLANLFIAINLGVFLYAVFKKAILRNYLCLFALTTIAEILFVTPIARPLSEPQHPLVYIFLLLNDLRFIFPLAYLVYAKKGISDFGSLRITGDVLRPAFIFSLFPTILTTAIGFMRPEWLNFSRNKFIAYEAVYTILIFLWIFVVLPQKNLGNRENSAVKNAALPIFLYYATAFFIDTWKPNAPETVEYLVYIEHTVRYAIFLPWVAFRL